ncbi:MAG: M20/M25/M40 family metallo-hydrolase [Terriglobia bacterium]
MGADKREEGMAHLARRDRAAAGRGYELDFWTTYCAEPVGQLEWLLSLQAFPQKESPVMKRCLMGLFLSLLVVLPAAGQKTGTSEVLTSLGELPGVSGYEERVTAWLAERLAKFNPQVDTLGNVTVTLGAGTPHRLVVTSMDEPGYVVSAITAEGYLRVERLPQRGVHPWFELLHSAQPVEILTREGKLVPGVVAGLSTHLQPGRESPPEKRTDHLDRIFIDVGARSAEEVRGLGVDLLDPITLEKHAYPLAHGELTAPFVGDRAGVAALVRLVERMATPRLRGMLTVAFVVRRYMGNQGLDRLLKRIEPDEIIFVQRLEESDAPPGAGVLVTTFEGSEPGLAADLLRLGRENQIPARAELTEPAPRGRYTGALPLPPRAAVVGVPVKFPQTPAEVVSADEVSRVVELIALYLGVPVAEELERGWDNEDQTPPLTPSASLQHILSRLVEIEGVSGYEQDVAARIKNLLPAWARERATVDAKGNLVVRFGRASEKPRLVFVAHMDEIGWVVGEIGEDGRLGLERRGGFLEEYFLGHAVYVHTANGRVPAVLELPADYRTKKYERLPGREYIAYSGARTREEAEALGIRVGDSVTVPKKYRPLAGTRANARSFDDRVGSTALVAALWAIDPETIGREVAFVWAVEEEIGLFGAKHFAARAAENGGVPDFVFAVDTFVSGDSPLESPRFARGILGAGFVVRAVDSSNVAPRKWVDRVVAIARRHKIPGQYGVTGGGNDGAAFVPYGAVDIPLGWPLRYSHSAGEVADLKDIEALARIVAALLQEF